MAASSKTIVAIYNVMAKYINTRLMGQCLYELNQVEGNQSFRDTVNALCRYHFSKKRDSGQSVQCPHCKWGFYPGVIAQHIREKHGDEQ